MQARNVVAVVGAGFTGLLATVHLLRSGGDRQVLLFERTPPFGRGVAYGTDNASLLLNVPAGRMGAFADDSEHFWRWWRDRGGGAPTDFAPRAVS